MKEFDEVKLRDGRTGFIIDVYDDGYQVEFATPDGPHAYDDEFVPSEDIVSKVA